MIDGVAVARIIRAFIIFGIGIFLWLNKYHIYSFIDDFLITSPVEWHGYEISYGEDYRVSINNKRNFLLVSKQDNSVMFDMFEHGSEIVPSHRSVESFCNSKNCYDIKSKTLKIIGLGMMAAEAKFIKNDEVVFILFSSLPDTNIEIKIQASETDYDKLLSIVKAIQISKK